MFVSDSVKYVGVNDFNIDLFEGQYDVPNGMAYNSYVVLGEKIAVMDTVDKNFTDEWLNNVESVLEGKTPDYLVIQHMEPDHSASILAFKNKYPSATVVASSKAFVMMKNFYGEDFIDNRLVVAEGDALDLGGRTLTFLTATMVHWPEVIVTFDDKDKILFSADGFGKFGAIGTDEDWACEARRYYIGIVGKYGVQVQTLLKKVATLDVKIICPLHGPVLNEDLGYYINLYDIWSSYRTESEGVLICYTSVYGNTEKAVLKLQATLEDKGCEKVAINDLARCDMAEAVEDAFRYGKIVLASTTYNSDVFPFMREFINHLTERNFQNKIVGIIENGSWAPTVARVIKGMFEKSKNLTFTENTVSILSAMNENNIKQIEALAEELLG